MADSTEKLIPNTISDTGSIDEDSGLRQFRGMMSPWDTIKSFRETYRFLLRHASLHAVAYMSVLDIIEPDYEKRQSTLSTIWAEQLKVQWSEDDEMGMIQWFKDRFDIPEFMKKSMYPPACYVDMGDEMMGMSGYIWYASSDRIEKELHNCPLDIIGPDCCDLSITCGQYLCPSIGGTEMNVYLTERKGCGDPYCHVVWETKKKYGESVNADGYDWENWGPAVSGMRDLEKGKPRQSEPQYLTTGQYISPLGTTVSTGELYQNIVLGAMNYSGHAINAVRRLLKEDDMPKAQYIVKVIFEAAGKHMFGEWHMRKAARDWMGVPAEVDDGRVLSGYMSMIFQARKIDWKFAEFSPERSVIECSRYDIDIMGQFAEMTESYIAYFNGMAKTLVGSEWIVRLDEDAPEDVARFIIEKGLYGFRRQKPEYTHAKKQA